MTESIFTLSVVGLLAGFILSMPIAGPISVLITSNALKGRLRYCRLATIGASFADFVFIFVAVFGITKIYTVYKPYIPYILLAGAFFLGYVGFKIFRTRVDLEHPKDAGVLSEKIKKQERGGFLTGFLVSFLNPSLFISWMTSSFFIISFVSSLGFSTGGLDKNVHASLDEIRKMEGKSLQEGKVEIAGHKSAESGLRTSPEPGAVDSEKLAKEIMEHGTAPAPVYSSLLLSISYSFFVSLGSILWFFFLAWIIVKHRQRINIKLVGGLIRFFGIVLIGFGAFFLYKGIGSF